MRLQALTVPAVLPAGWEVVCVDGAAKLSGRGQWDLPLHTGINDAGFCLRRNSDADEHMVDVTTQVVRGGVLRGFRLPDGEPYGTLVLEPADVGDADVRWTLQLPAHGPGFQSLVPELEGGGLALPPGWALHVAIFDGAGIRTEPAVVQPFGELQLPAVALEPGGVCVAELFVAEGHRTVGPTHIVTIQRDLPVLSGFRLSPAEGEPYGKLVRLTPALGVAGGDADVRWTLELPAHGPGLQMLVPELVGGGLALPPGWALRVTCLAEDAEGPQPPIPPVHEGSVVQFHELQLPHPSAPVQRGSTAVARVVLLDAGGQPTGRTHVITVTCADWPWPVRCPAITISPYYCFPCVIGPIIVQLNTAVFY